MSKFDEKYLSKWWDINGDVIHCLNYPLHEHSTVMDIGGFKGSWASKIIALYNPTVYIVEPVSEHYNLMLKRFAENDKVKLMNVGVSDKDEDAIISLDSESSSLHFSSEKNEKIKLLTMRSILNKWNLKKIDLLQINIEGHEYTLLEHLMNKDILDKFKYIQVQFHLGVHDDVSRREAIRKKFIQRGFKNRFDYPFVWEAWEKI